MRRSQTTPFVLRAVGRRLQSDHHIQEIYMRKYLGLLTLAVLPLTGCTTDRATADESSSSSASAIATFAGGCFWCMEPPFDKLEGVGSTTSGYIGGTRENPTYREVAAGKTRYTEAVQVAYDPNKITYEELLDVFWRNIDPTVEDRQFCDWGSQYRTGIFYHNDSQRALAEASKTHLIESGRFPQVVTEVTNATRFYPAEEYHQDYYKKNPVRYKTYRAGCGRDRRLAELWGDS